ncbi:hypothetical protein PG989_001889 [Apiospora arundinis]
MVIEIQPTTSIGVTRVEMRPGLCNVPLDSIEDTLACLPCRREEKAWQSVQEVHEVFVVIPEVRGKAGPNIEYGIADKSAGAGLEHLIFEQAVDAPGGPRIILRGRYTIKLLSEKAHKPSGKDRHGVCTCQIAVVVTMDSAPDATGLWHAVKGDCGGSRRICFHPGPVLPRKLLNLLKNAHRELFEGQLLAGSKQPLHVLRIAENKPVRNPYKVKSTSYPREHIWKGWGFPAGIFSLQSSRRKANGSEAKG